MVFPAHSSSSTCAKTTCNFLKWVAVLETLPPLLLFYKNHFGTLSRMEPFRISVQSIGFLYSKYQLCYCSFCFATVQVKCTGGFHRKFISSFSSQLTNRNRKFSPFPTLAHVLRSGIKYFIILNLYEECYFGGDSQFLGKVAEWWVWCDAQRYFAELEGNYRGEMKCIIPWREKYIISQRKRHIIWRYLGDRETFGFWFSRAVDF